MRMTCLIIGIVGGICCGLLGMQWISDYNESKALIDIVEEVAGESEELAELERAVISAYMLLAATVLGIAGGILGFVGKGKIGAPVMLVGAILPAVFALPSLLAGSLLIIGAVFAFLAKPKTAMAASSGE
ncbi:MAG: hypothetical protein QGG42_06480 [Phycisphaerae bacterium]|nr:hypothetical protein [Phycisphaerae bacterium]